jgi:two-component system nitrogen regulation response regulator GlnG
MKRSSFVEFAFMKASTVLTTVPSVSADADELVGRSPQMLEVYKSIGRVAEQDVAVLVLGESGTGEELIARAI